MSAAGIKYHWCRPKDNGNRGSLQKYPRSTYNMPTVCMTCHQHKRQSNGCIQCVVTQSNQHGLRQSDQGTAMDGRCSPSATCQNTNRRSQGMFLINQKSGNHWKWPTLHHCMVERYKMYTPMCSTSGKRCSQTTLASFQLACNEATNTSWPWSR